MNSIIFQLQESLRLFRKKSLLYILSFYIALFLPMICYNNIARLNTISDQIRSKPVQDQVIFNWSTSSIAEFEKGGYKDYSLRIIGESYIEKKQGETKVVVYGINEKEQENYAVESGRLFTGREIKEGSKICLLGKEYGYKLGEEVEFRNGEKYKVVGILRQEEINRIIMPIKSMEFIGWFSYKAVFPKEDARNIKEYIKANFVKPEHIREEDAEADMQKSINHLNSEKQKNLILIIIGLAFFIINQSIISFERLKENNKLIALKLCMGVKIEEIFLVSLIESVIMSIISNVLLFTTTGLLKTKVEFLKNINMDLRLVLTITLISMLICCLMNMIAIFIISKFDIKNILIFEEGS